MRIPKGRSAGRSVGRAVGGGTGRSVGLRDVVAARPEALPASTWPAPRRHPFACPGTAPARPHLLVADVVVPLDVQGAPARWQPGRADLIRLRNGQWWYVYNNGDHPMATATAATDLVRRAMRSHGATVAEGEPLGGRCPRPTPMPVVARTSPWPANCDRPTRTRTNDD